MKVLLKLLLLLALAVYLAFAFTRMTGGGDPAACTELKVAIVDSANAGFITPAEVGRLLRKGGLYPVGRPVDSVRGKDIEALLMKNPFIRRATCYKTPGGRVNVLVEQRMPVMRILSDNGDNYYIDEDGTPMRPDGYEANLVVATGRIDKAYVRRYLVRLGRYLRADDFWDNQIEQINVTPEGTMELVPRVGEHVLYVGKPVNLQRKLRNLRLFYEKVLPTVGWNKYSRINLEYENQIICTRSQKA